MKRIFSRGTIVMLAFSSGLLMTSCGGGDTTNAENKDTISTYIEPQPDNATVRPDTMQTQLPKDSTTVKDTMK